GDHHAAARSRHRRAFQETRAGLAIAHQRDAAQDAEAAEGGEEGMMGDRLGDPNSQSEENAMARRKVGKLRLEHNWAIGARSKNRRIRALDAATLGALPARYARAGKLGKEITARPWSERALGADLD